MTNITDSKRNAKREFLGLDAGPGPARPLSPADVEWLVEQVVERALEPTRKPRSRLLRLRSLSLAALVIVTSAAAATVVHQVHKSATTSAPDVTGPQRQPQKPRSLRVLPHPTSEPITEAALSADIAAPPRELTTPSTSVQNSTLPAKAAADQLSAANELRRRAQWQAAEAAYSDVAARYPGAQEAFVAQLAAAELRLDYLGDAAGALRLYQSVPRGNPLGVEALFGVSRAYRALGDGEAETAALRSLIDAYPTSLQADGARRRLKLAAPSGAP